MSDLNSRLDRLFRTTRAAYSPDDATLARVRADLDAKLNPTAPHGSSDEGRGTSHSRGERVLRGHKLPGSFRVTIVGLAIGLTAAWLFHSFRAELLTSPVQSTTAPARQTVDSQTSNAGAGQRGVESLFAPTTPESVIPGGARAESAPAAKGHNPPAQRRVGGSKPRERRSGRSPSAEQPQKSARANETPPELATQAGEDTLALELAVLRAGHAAIERGAPASALDLLDRHAQEHPLGILRQERLATRVLALCALGRIRAAHEAANQLARVAPRSPHLMRLRESCIGSGAPRTP